MWVVDYSLGGGNAAGGTNVKLSEQFRIREGMPICFQQVVAAWQRCRVFLYNAIKFPCRLNRRPCSWTQSVLDGSSIKKEELLCPDGWAIYSWQEV